MKLGATDSIKFKKLKIKLGLTHWQAVGLLESLWMFTSRDAPSGDIGRHPDDDIAAAIEWLGEPDKLIQVLVDCRWVDRSEEHRLVIHDWADHLPTWLSGNLKKHGKSPIVTQPTAQVATQAAKQDRCEPTTQPAVEDSQPAAQAPSYSYQFNSIQSRPIQATEVTPEIASQSKENPNPKDPNPQPPSPPGGPTHGRTFLTSGTGDLQFKEFLEIVPGPLRCGVEGMWGAYQERRFQISVETGIGELLAGIGLKERYRAYLASPRGRQKTHRWSVKTWLDDKHDLDDDEAWNVQSADSNHKTPGIAKVVNGRIQR